MYEAVAAVLKSHQETVDVIKAFVTAQSDMDILMLKIKGKGRDKNEATAGKAKSKGHSRAGLIVATMKVASALCSYGRRIGNIEVVAIANLNESDLWKNRDAEMISISTTIHVRGTEHLDKLSDYGVTKVELDDLAAKLGSFSAALSRRELGVAQQVGATAALGQLFRETDDLIKNEIDKLVQLVREVDDAFYREYFAARVIKDLGKRYEPKTPAVTQPVAPITAVVVPPPSPPLQPVV